MTLQGMLLVPFFLSLAAALSTAPTVAPTPQATTLPEIGRVRSTHICAVLRDRINPALVRLAHSDGQLQTGKLAFLDMGTHQVSQNRGALELDQVHVEFAVRKMVEDLAAVDALLTSPADFPKSPQSDDGRTAADIKAKFKQIEAEQQTSINVMNGTIETDRLGAMQHEGFELMAAAVGPQRGEAVTPMPLPTVEPISFIGVAGLPAPPDLIVDPRSVEAQGLAADTMYGKLAGALHDEQLRAAKIEDELEATVVALARGCTASPSAPPNKSTP